METIDRDATGVHTTGDGPWMYAGCLPHDSEQDALADEPPTVRKPHGSRCDCRTCDPDSYFDMVAELREVRHG